MTISLDVGEPGERPVLHGDFTLDVHLDVPPADVFAAFERADLRSRWLRLPGRPGLETAVDLQTGVSETLRAELRSGGRTERVERRTHVLDVVRDRRLVLAYQAVVDGSCRWTSLVTVRIDPWEAGSRLTWTEQYAFLDAVNGDDDLAHLRGGTRLLLNGLAVALGTTPRPAAQR